jgi:nicotinate-nucleotide adenylyltransferase
LSSQQQTEFIFGGSFDPVHLGHINLLVHLKQFFPSWGIRVLPCANPPLKQPTLASFSHRVAMLKLGLEHLEKITIDPREHQRSGKSFTYHSLRDLRTENPDIKLVLVLGADAMKSINQWYRVADLSQLCHLVIVNRPRTLLSQLESNLQQLGFNCAISKQELELEAFGRYHCLTVEERDISSTEIRERLAENQSIEHLVSSCVINYIDDNHPY